MPYTAPEVGKTYVSKEDPALRLYIERVQIVEPDETFEGDMIVECCAPEDRGNADRPGYELLGDEWAHFNFQPEPEEAAA